MQNDTILLDVPAIFSWSAVLGYLNRDPNEIAYRFKGRTIYRAFRIQQRNYLVKVDRLNEHRQLRIQWLKPKNRIPAGVKRYVKAFVTKWFDLRTDLHPFYRMAKGDPVLKKIIRPLNGLRLIRFPNLYESIIWEILGQQINVALAYRLKRNFIKEFSYPVNYHGMTAWTFPEPRDVAGSDVDTLFKLGLTHRKAEYVLGISKLLATHRISKGRYLELPNTQAMLKALEKLRGIGPWGANCICMRGLNRGDAMPAADIGLLNGIKAVLNLKAKPSKALVHELQKKWGHWSAYATFYIWRYLY